MSLRTQLASLHRSVQSICGQECSELGLRTILTKSSQVSAECAGCDMIDSNRQSITISVLVLLVTDGHMQFSVGYIGCQVQSGISLTAVFEAECFLQYNNDQHAAMWRDDMKTDDRGNQYNQHVQLLQLLW